MASVRVQMESPRPAIIISNCKRNKNFMVLARIATLIMLLVPSSLLLLLQEQHMISELRVDADVTNYVDYKIWAQPNSEGFHQCIQPSKNRERNPVKATNGYLVVHANGGLNQMKMGICDMVAVAKLMNATLVVPYFDHTSYWKDPSEFGDIFDLKHFIKTLEADVRIVKRLPAKYKGMQAHVMKPRSWSKAFYYQKELSKILKQKKVIEFAFADARLANNDVPRPIQKLRCRACYKALRFTDKIQELGNTVISRLRATGNRYLALHLRYEKDMLAFTGCNHNLTSSQAEELRLHRLSVVRWKEKNIDGDEKRREGRCPMTPRETVKFLKAMGYPSSTVIYIVAGEIYGTNSLEIIKEEYPRLYTHHSLTTPAEMGALRVLNNQLAALDYIVALSSDVFVYTHDGNMAKAVEGHRRFEGFRKTISPDRRKYVELIDRFDNGEMNEIEFQERVKEEHETRIGGPLMRRRGEIPKQEDYFYANPLPGCICH
ncbi:uncharacterized protein At1g04910-like [Asparagus officinalis]|uniref:uncharacterized protein At1g04910-like n=1 Tax=Asparagus officinalis TaxID=4686 RepID=UPI00098E0C2F|nr:uncharacterized protein At1g04910-like [Asparagus officinalis]